METFHNCQDKNVITISLKSFIYRYYRFCVNLLAIKNEIIQGDFESCADIRILGKNILKILSKNKMTFIF
jgi:hypothetical protein